MLALDFDATNASPGTVIRDVARCVAWIRACGGTAVVDRSTSGGMHVLVPLPTGTSVSRAEIEPALRLLTEVFPRTLDITPMLNDRTGCITPPGSPCREGGYRRLTSTTLEDAVDTFHTRSSPGFLQRLTNLHGTASTSAGRRHTPLPANHSATPTTPRAGHGDHLRLSPTHCLSSPIPDAVRRFATDGIAPPGRWRHPDGRLDRSAARQSVLTAAALRGMTLTDIYQNLPAAGGSWKAFARTYARYGRGADAALRRDWTRACGWAAANAPEFLSSAHKNQQHTGGWRPRIAQRRRQTEWLAAATLWVDATWPHSPRRWTILAVLQALAHATTLTNTNIRRKPVTEIGGRSLSLMAALPETTVWAALRDLRAQPGAPILRTRRAGGILADCYALVTPALHHRPVRADHAHLQRIRVEPVHPAWQILGHHSRRLFELITHVGLTHPADLAAAAGTSRSATYAALTTLTSVGLITHTRNNFCPGTTQLDDIANAHGLAAARNDRITRHHHQRSAWREWLTRRFGPHITAEIPTCTAKYPVSLDNLPDWHQCVMPTPPLELISQANSGPICPGAAPGLRMSPTSARYRLSSCRRRWNRAAG
ncbi:hypothetical protein [Nocardia nova]|uniref:hypothetical protein n=1 Tax=Nocardia nova TaxID=37330 RepID=UPI0011B04296|nr:hypothetical protein [Nocardia nova]